MLRVSTCNDDTTCFDGKSVSSGRAHIQAQRNKHVGTSGEQTRDAITYTTLRERADVLGANGTEEGADENDGGLHLVDLLCVESGCGDDIWCWKY